MKKKADWQKHFNDFIEKNKNKEFVWGEWDCCLFADACIKKMTGESLIPKSLVWRNEKEALQTIKDYGKNLLESVSKACKGKKLKTIKKAFVTTGDLVVFKEETQLVGISDGFKILAPSKDGLITKSHDLILKAWRID